MASPMFNQYLFFFIISFATHQYFIVNTQAMWQPTTKDVIFKCHYASVKFQQEETVSGLKLFSLTSPFVACHIKYALNKTGLILPLFGTFSDKIQKKNSLHKFLEFLFNINCPKAYISICFDKEFFENKISDLPLINISELFTYRKIGTCTFGTRIHA